MTFDFFFEQLNKGNPMMDEICFYFKNDENETEHFIGIWTELGKQQSIVRHSGACTCKEPSCPHPWRACGQEPLAEDCNQGQPEATQYFMELEKEKSLSSLSDPLVGDSHWLSSTGSWDCMKKESKKKKSGYMYMYN